MFSRSDSKKDKKDKKDGKKKDDKSSSSGPSGLVSLDNVDKKESKKETPKPDKKPMDPRLAALRSIQSGQNQGPTSGSLAGTSRQQDPRDQSRAIVPTRNQDRDRNSGDLRDLRDVDRDEQQSRPSRSDNQGSSGPPPLASFRVPQSAAPPEVKSVFKTKKDEDMAKRQVRFESLSPQERIEQEDWAQCQLRLNAGVCAAGFGFRRVYGGYLCSGGSHLIPDEMLAEGKGGYYTKYIAWWSYWWNDFPTLAPGQTIIEHGAFLWKGPNYACLTPVGVVGFPVGLRPHFHGGFGPYGPHGYGYGGGYGYGPYY